MACGRCDERLIEHTLRMTDLDLDWTVNGHGQRGLSMMHDASSLHRLHHPNFRLKRKSMIPLPLIGFHTHPVLYRVPSFSNSTVLQRTTGTLYKCESGLPVATRLFLHNPQQKSQARNQSSIPLPPQYATRQISTIQSVCPSNLNRLSSFRSSVVVVYTSTRKILYVCRSIEPHLTLRRAPTYHIYEPSTVPTSGLTSPQNTHLVIPPADATYRAYRPMVIPGMTIAADDIWVMKEVPRQERQRVRPTPLSTECIDNAPTIG